MPYFSIIMASYNTRKYLADAIRSVAEQTFENWELIVVDDASEDSSYDIASHYASTDRRIKALRLTTNRGAGAARNYAATVATGEWLAILDADDLFLPHKLRCQHDYILACRNPKLGLVGSGYALMDQGGRLLKTYKTPCDSSTLKRNLYSGGMFPPHSSIVYRTKAFNLVNGFNELMRACQDFDLWLRLSALFDFGCIPLPMVKYRSHASGLSGGLCPLGYSQRMYGIAAIACHRTSICGGVSPGNDRRNFDILMRIVRDAYLESALCHADLHHRQLQNMYRLRNRRDLLRYVLRNPRGSTRALLRAKHVSMLVDTVLSRYVGNADSAP